MPFVRRPAATRCVTTALAAPAVSLRRAFRDGKHGDAAPFWCGSGTCGDVQVENG